MQKEHLFNLLDLLYLLFSILYIIGDRDVLDNDLKYVKPIPIWIMIFQLYKQRCPQTFWIMVALFFGSLGDILLLISGDSLILFAKGAAKFLIGHIIYVSTFLNLSSQIAGDTASLKQVVKKKALFILIWLIHISLAFLSIGFLKQKGVIKYVIPVYATCLLLLTMGGFFFYFITRNVPNFDRRAGVLIMLGTIIFYLSDNFLAQDNFNKNVGYTSFFENREWLNTILIMGTYYVAQFMLGKGSVLVARYLKYSNVQKLRQSGQPQRQSVNTIN